MQRERSQTAEHAQCDFSYKSTRKGWTRRRDAMPRSPGEEGLLPHFEEGCQHTPSRLSALFRNCPCRKKMQRSKAGPLPGQPTTGQHRGLSDYFLCNWKHLWRAFPETHPGSTQASTKTKLQLSFSSSPTLLPAFLFLPQVLLPRAILLKAHLSLRVCFPEFPMSSWDLRCEKWGQWWLWRGGRGERRGQDADRQGCW